MIGVPSAPAAPAPNAARGRQLAGELLADQPQRLHAADLELGQHAEELVRILHRPPARCAGLRSRSPRPDGRRRRARAARLRAPPAVRRDGGRSARRKPAGRSRRWRRSCAPLRRRHRRTAGSPLALLERLAHGKAMAPLAEEQPQVDVGPAPARAPLTCTSSKRPCRSCTQCSFRVRHITRPTEGMSASSARQSAARPSRFADAQYHQLGFADAQGRGGVADAQRRFLAAQAVQRAARSALGDESMVFSFQRR